MILSIIFGLIICFALPIFLEKYVKRKTRKALRICCYILGGSIIIMSIISNII